MWAAWAASKGFGYDPSEEDDGDMTISEQQRLLALRRKMILAAVRESLEEAIEEVHSEDKPPLLAGKSSKSSLHRKG